MLPRSIGWYCRIAPGTWLGIIGARTGAYPFAQSVRYCVKAETERYTQSLGSVRTLVPRLLDQHRLLSREPGTRTGDDRWLEEMSQTIFQSSPAQAADAVATALAEGFAGTQLFEAVSLAANQLILRDNGRPGAEGPGKPAGSVHGDSIGVHACDSANAWRNLARAAEPAQQDRRACSSAPGKWPMTAPVAAVVSSPGNPTRGGGPRTSPGRRTGPATARPGGSDSRPRPGQRRRTGRTLWRQCLPTRPLWDMLLRYATSEDGALHAEKFYRTATEEFAVRPPLLPLAPPHRAGTRHRERPRLCRARVRRGMSLAGDLTNVRKLEGRRTFRIRTEACPKERTRKTRIIPDRLDYYELAPSTPLVATCLFIKALREVEWVKK